MLWWGPGATRWINCNLKIDCPGCPKTSLVRVLSRGFPGFAPQVQNIEVHRGWWGRLYLMTCNLCMLFLSKWCAKVCKGVQRSFWGSGHSDGSMLHVCTCPFSLLLILCKSINQYQLIDLGEVGSAACHSFLRKWSHQIVSLLLLMKQPE